MLGHKVIDGPGGMPKEYNLFTNNCQCFALKLIAHLCPTANVTNIHTISQVVDVFGQYSDSPMAEIAEKTEIIKTQHAAVINAAAVMEAVTPIRMP